MTRILTGAIIILSIGLLTSCAAPYSTYNNTYYDAEPYHYDTNEYNEFDVGYVTTGDYYPYPDYYPDNYNYIYGFPSVYYSHYHNYHNWNNSGVNYGGHWGGGHWGGSSGGHMGMTFHHK